MSKKKSRTVTDLMGVCRVLLPATMCIYPVAISVSSLIVQLEKEHQSSGVDSLELNDKGWITVKLLDQPLHEESNPVALMNGEITFTVSHGQRLVDVIQVLKEVQRRLLEIKMHQPLAHVESFHVKNGIVTIKVKEIVASLPNPSKVQINEIFLILDGNNILSRAFFATAHNGPDKLMRTNEGLYTNAVYGFIGMLSRYVKDYSPTYLAVAWDVSRDSTRRRKRYPEYKRNRPETDPILKAQFPIVKALLDRMNIAQLQVDGYEADDIIGTLSKSWSSQKKGKCLLASSDKDLFQLLNEQTVQLVKGRSGEREYTSADFQMDFGLEPYQWPCVKGLLGDDADNLPGCKGVGKAAAAPLIRQYGSLEAVFENIEEIKQSNFKRYAKKLQEGKEASILTKELSIITDALDLKNIDVNDFKLKIDRDAMIKSFKELEFDKFIESKAFIA